MSVQPQYAAAPLSPIVNFATANANRDGTGTIATLVTARVPGSRIERVVVKSLVTTTAGMIRIFKRDNGLTLNADGSIASYATPTWRLLHEIPVSATTASGTAATFAGDWAPTNGFNLAPFEQLGIATNNAEAFNAQVFGGLL
jgi:hypothetical protein